MFFNKRSNPNSSSSNLTVRSVLGVLKGRRFPTLRQWTYAGRVLSAKEKRVVAVAGGLALLALFVLAGEFFFAHRIEIPAVGGEYTEGLVGQPQFINPLYAPLSDADADLSHLVYSGLMRFDAKNGLVNDLATNVAVSADGLTYTVTMRADARFNTGDAVSPKDVLFTFEALRDPQYRSPLSPQYQNVDVTQTGDDTLVFTLKQPDVYFTSLLTVGILPSDVWSGVAPRNMPLAVFNLKPIGSGPYKLETFSKDKTGHVTSYTLVRNDDYYGQKPNIQHLTFKFYDDEPSALKALESHYVEGLAYVPPELEGEAAKIHAITLMHPVLPDLAALVFNQARQPILQNAAVRQAIALAIDRQAVVNQVFGGHATATANPVLDEVLPASQPAVVPAVDVAAANKLLDDAGFLRPDGGQVRVEKPQPPAHKKGQPVPATTPIPLSFTLTTVQQPQFMQVAQMIGNDLAAIGIQVQINGVDPKDLSSTVLSSRSFDLLLTSFSFGNDPDPYPFWDSSQIGNGGLNVAGYASKQADGFLEKARQTADTTARAALYAQFNQQFSTDLPAVFLYRPTYTYAPGNKVKNVTLTNISAPSDRFADIADWYVNTKLELK